MFQSVSPETIQALSESSLFPIIEFTMISIIVISAYLAVHNMLNKLHPATKMLVSMFMGTMAYTIGKVALFTLFVGQSAHAVNGF